MSSPQNTFAPTNTKSSSYRSLGIVGILSIALLLPVKSAHADIGTYSHLTPDCSTILTWDGVGWSEVEVAVGPGFAQGLYGVRLQYYNGGGFVGYTSNIDVRMSADGSYTV